VLVTNSSFAAQRREHRMSLLSDDDGNKIARYRGGWKDGAFEYEVAFERPDGDVGSGIQLIRRSFRPTPDGLLVTVAVNPPDGLLSVGLYRHAEDIPMPTPAKAVIGDLEWLSGAWVGTRSSGSSIEERRVPPLGGEMHRVIAAQRSTANSASSAVARSRSSPGRRHGTTAWGDCSVQREISTLKGRHQ
jgi:hypothetical protein